MKYFLKKFFRCKYCLKFLLPLENLSQPAVENSNQRRLYMKKSGFSESQIVAIFKEAKLGAKHGVSEPTYYKWKSQFSGMTVPHPAQLSELQDENARLKRMYADLALMHNALKDVVDRKL